MERVDLDSSVNIEQDNDDRLVWYLQTPISSFPWALHFPWLSIRCKYQSPPDLHNSDFIGGLFCEAHPPRKASPDKRMVSNSIFTGKEGVWGLQWPRKLLTADLVQKKGGGEEHKGVQRKTPSWPSSFYVLFFLCWKRYCSKCESNQRAIKSQEFWRSPPPSLFLFLSSPNPISGRLHPTHWFQFSQP